MACSAKLSALTTILTLLVLLPSTHALAVDIVAADEDKPIVEFYLSLDSSEVTADAATAEEAPTCETEACETEACESEPCDSATANDETAEQPVTPDDIDVAPAATPAVVRPTHKQTAVLTVNGDGLDRAQLKSFCLSATGDILAACQVGDAGEIRILAADGEYQSSWSLPVAPEAINFGSDGHVYVAGQGKLFRMTDAGEIVTEADAPHVASILENIDAFREQVIEQQKRTAQQYAQMLERYEEHVARAKQSLEAAEERLEILEAMRDVQADEETDSDETEAETEAAIVRGKARVKMHERQLANAERIQEQMSELLGQQADPEEMTDEELEEKVRASLEYKSRVASISESAGQVFLATAASQGHGFAVWRMDTQFTSAETIVEGLSGCCGQMDVQACRDGLFVAENSRHRVCRFDADGEKITDWGGRATSGVEGFGSCCNPMNVAFGDATGDATTSVYTAESSTGRIKRYDSDGNLLELVGKVDLVPGCKKVSIAVGPSGDRVYMLDITRHHIVMMERLAEDESVDYSEARAEAPADGEQQPTTTSRSNPFGAFVRIISRSLTGN